MMTPTKQQEFDILAAELRTKVEGLTVELFDYLYPEFAKALSFLEYYYEPITIEAKRVIIRDDAV